jgi:hypothetical protein
MDLLMFFELRIVRKITKNIKDITIGILELAPRRQIQGK